MRERGVEPKPRQHDADAVRPDNAQEMRLCRVECGLLQRLTPLTEFAETGSNDYSRARAPRRQFMDQTRNCLGRRDDDPEIRGAGQAGDIRMNGQSIYGVVMGVDQHQLAGKPSAAKVPRNYRADGARTRRCADQRDRSRCEQLVEIANGHWPLRFFTLSREMRFSGRSESQTGACLAGSPSRRPGRTSPA